MQLERPPIESQKQNLFQPLRLDQMHLAGRAYPDRAPTLKRNLRSVVFCGHAASADQHRAPFRYRKIARYGRVLARNGADGLLRGHQTAPHDEDRS